MNKEDMKEGLSIYEQSILDRIEALCPSSIVNNAQRRKLAVEFTKHVRKKMEALKQYYDKRQGQGGDCVL